MIVVVGGKQYEIGGIAYGQLPAWRLIKHGGQPMTGQQFDQLPEADKLTLFQHVQRHIKGLDEITEMPEERPFLEDGSQFGISSTAFEEMDEDDQREAMREWFYQNFEGPENETPRADGEFMYIWGGPFDAKEQLWNKFGDIVSETLIDEAVEEVEKDGTVDWAPTSNSPFYEHPETQNDDDGVPEPLVTFLANLSDEPGPMYGTVKDREARRRAIEALAHLETILPAAGIGHNHPPEAIEQEPAEGDLRPVAQKLRAELEKDQPGIPLVKSLTALLGKPVVAGVKWTGRKVDIVIEEAAKSFGNKLGAALAVSLVIGPQIRSVIVETLNYIINWLHLVALGF